MDELYLDWIPKDVSSSKILDLLRIPYIPYWSFGERLPVIEEGTSDPTSLGFALEFLARTISTNLNWKEALSGAHIVSDITSTSNNNLDSEEIMDESHVMKAKDYMEARLDNQINWYSRKSVISQRLYKSITFFQLFCALSIPLIAANGTEILQQNVTNMIISALGVIVAFCTGMLSLNKYQENWVNYRTIAEELKKEKYMFITESPPYQYPDDSFRIFVSRVESIISRENSGWRKNHYEEIEKK